jgi:VanZ family protein
MRLFLKYRVPSLIWMAVIFLGSTDVLSAEHTSRFLVPLLRWLDPQITLATLNLMQTVIRKLGHVTEYAILAVLLWRAVRGATAWASKRWILFVTIWVICAIFAASDEFHQSFVPSRTSSFHDVMIDISGVLVGLTICIALAARKVVKQSGA